MLVPNLSVCTSMATSDRTSSTPVRAAKFLNASRRGLPARVSVVIRRSSSASAGYDRASSSEAFTIAASRPAPASTHTMSRSSASGRPFWISFWRCDVFSASQNPGSAYPTPAASSAKMPPRMTPRLATVSSASVIGTMISAAAK